MTTSEYGAISDLIGTAFEGLGGRALVRDVIEKVRGDLPDDLADYLLTAGLKTQVQAFFRRKNTAGLPEAPCVDDTGTHVQQELLTLDDLKYLVTRHVKSGRASYAMAEAYATEARTRYGVLIEVDVAATG